MIEVTEHTFLFVTICSSVRDFVSRLSSIPIALFIHNISPVLLIIVAL